MGALWILCFAAMLATGLGGGTYSDLVARAVCDPRSYTKAKICYGLICDWAEKHMQCEERPLANSLPLQTGVCKLQAGYSHSIVPGGFEVIS